MPALLIFIIELTVLLQTILIHSGAGAFGQASTAIPQQRGATVYTTVSTEAKKDYLLSELGLPREYIFQSRDISFVGRVMAATNGKGVDDVSERWLSC